MNINRRHFVRSTAIAGAAGVVSANALTPLQRLVLLNNRQPERKWGAVSFTASDKAYLSIANANQTGLNPGTGDYSYSFWVNLVSNTSSFSYILRRYTNNGIKCYININSAIIVTHGDGTDAVATSSPSVIPVGIWTNITVVANRNGNLYAYKNGNVNTPIITLDISAKTSAISNTADFLCGGEPTNTYYLNGSMDSVCYLNRALTLQEVVALYNGGKGRCAAELPTAMPDFWRDCVSWWDMDEQGGVRRDSKGTNHLQETFSPIISPTVLNGGFESLGTGETLSSELIVNGGFETLGAGGADVFGMWTGVASDGAISNETTLKHGGSNAAKLTAGATKATRLVYGLSVTGGTRYKFTFWTAGDGANAGQYSLYDTTNAAAITAVLSTNIVSSAYNLVSFYFTTAANCVAISIGFRCPNAVGGTAYFDDVSLKQVTASNTFLNWTESTAGSSTINAEASVVNSGALACRMDVDASGAAVLLKQPVLTRLHKYIATLYAKSSATPAILYIGTEAGGFESQSITTSYAPYSKILDRKDAVNLYVTHSASSNGKSIYLDDITLTCTRIEGAKGIA